MIRLMNNILLLYFSLTAAITASPLSQHRVDKPAFFLGVHLKNKPPIINPLKTLAKRTALAWKQVESVEYSYSSSSEEKTEWSFFTHDTIIYDAAGNEIVKKYSRVQNSWERNNLKQLDSTTYVNGNIVEFFSINFDTQGDIKNGQHQTYAYYSDGKNFVSTDCEWNSTTKKWDPTEKDSIVFSSPGHFNPYWDMDLSDFIVCYKYKFESEDSTWIPKGSLSRIAEECNATTMAIGSRTENEDSSVHEEKWIITFESSNWKLFNGKIEQTMQQKDPNTWVYYNLLNDITFYDSHGNDSLIMFCQPSENSAGWDTISMNRQARKYDINGNNTLTVYSDYDFDKKIWSDYYKEENIFAQINVPVIQEKQKHSRQQVSLETISGITRFHAPGITGLNLYNSSGQKLYSQMQMPGSTISLSLDSYRKMAPGACFAEIAYKNGKTTFPLIIHK